MATLSITPESFELLEQRPTAFLKSDTIWLIPVLVRQRMGGCNTYPLTCIRSALGISSYEKRFGVVQTRSGTDGGVLGSKLWQSILTVHECGGEETLPSQLILFFYS